MRTPFPGRLHRSKKCPRCGLRYSKNASSCTHCTGLDDDQLRMIKARHRKRAAANDDFDKLLLLAAGLAVVIAIILAL